MSFFSNRRQSEPDPPERQGQLSTLSAPQHPIGFETVLGASTTLEGTLESHANIRLDGEFTGTLKITGNVLVGETAQINADVNAKNVSIAGAVRGNVSGNRVQILRTGRVWGDITAVALATEEGAFIDGKISMMSKPEDTIQAQPEPTPEPEQSPGSEDDTAILPRKKADDAINNIENAEDNGDNND